MALNLINAQSDRAPVAPERSLRTLLAQVLLQERSVRQFQQPVGPVGKILDKDRDWQQ